MAARNVARVRVEAFGSPTRREEKIGLAMSADGKRQFSTVVDRLNVGQVPAAEGI